MATDHTAVIEAYNAKKRFMVLDAKGKIISYHGTKRGAEVKAKGLPLTVTEIAAWALTELHRVNTTGA